ncbi:MAG TPA: hypothetical protein DDZ89_02850 [Clostridiales bacterium]|nr:hypothetical protein [Clostridiales bacterium]
MRLLRLSMIIIIVFFSACSDMNQDPDSTTTTEQKAVETMAYTGITLYFYGVDAGFSRSIDHTAMCDEITEITENILKLRVNFEFAPPSEYKNQLAQRINSGDQVDVFDYNTVLDDLTMDIVSQYQLADLTDLLPDHYPIGAEMLKTDPEFINLYGIDGRLYLPPCYGGYRFSNLYTVVADRALLQATDTDEINNFSQFLKFYNKCKEKELLKNDYVFYMDVDLFIRLYMEHTGYHYLDFGIVYDSNNKEIIPMEYAPDFTDAYLLYQSMLTDGLLRELPADMNQPAVNSMDAVLKNRYPVYACLHSDFITNGLLGYSQFNDQYKVNLLNLDRSYYVSYKAKPQYCITDHGKAKEALEFLNLLHTHNQVYDLLRYGVNNVNFKLAGEKVEFKTNMKNVFNWRSSSIFIPDLERQFAYEHDDTFYFRTHNIVKVPYSLENYLESNRYIIENKELLEISKFRGIRSINPFWMDMENWELYSKIKAGLSVEDFVELIHDEDLDQYIEVYKNHLLPAK